MKLEDYIGMLQRKLEEVGNLEVAMTQGGYYADGKFADMYDDPKVESIELGRQIHWVDGKAVYGESNVQKFIVLGHSYQSY